MGALEPLGRRDVQGRILANCRVGTGTGLDAHDKRRCNQPARLQTLGILAGNEVVRDHGDPKALPHGEEEEVVR